MEADTFNRFRRQSNQRVALKARSDFLKYITILGGIDAQQCARIGGNEHDAHTAGDRQDGTDGNPAGRSGLLAKGLWCKR